MSGETSPDDVVYFTLDQNVRHGLLLISCRSPFAVVKIIQVILIPNITETAIAAGFLFGTVALAAGAKQQLSLNLRIGGTHATKSAAYGFILIGIIDF